MMKFDSLRIVASAALLAALVLMVSCQKQETPTLATTGPVLDSVPSADGVTIYYEVRGAGDRVLMLVHCWNCDRSYWDAQVDDLSRDYRVVTLDLAGHGQSGMGRSVWSMAAYGGDVAAVVKKLALQDVILVGHSMGGAVCIEAARQLPGVVKAIVGVDTYQDLVQKMDSTQALEMIAPFQANFSATTEAFVRSMFPPGADSALVERVAKDMAAGPAEVGIGSFEQVFNYDGAAAMKDMRVPIRAINSDRYPTNVEGNRAVASSFEVTYMPGRGHFLHMEDSATFNNLLRQTIAEFWPPAAKS